MTDFKGINPDKQPHIQFGSNRNGKQSSPEQSPECADSTPAVDPYADSKMDPDRMLSLMSAQAQWQGKVPSNSSEASMASFAQAISPERHAQATRLMQDTYQQEFGKKPSSSLLQEMVDNYLVGQVAIQS